MTNLILWLGGAAMAVGFMPLVYHLGSVSGRKELEAQRYDSARIEATRALSATLHALTTALQRRA